MNSMGMCACVCVCLRIYLFCMMEFPCVPCAIISTVYQCIMYCCAIKQLKQINRVRNIFFCFRIDVDVVRCCCDDGVGAGGSLHLSPPSIPSWHCKKFIHTGCVVGRAQAFRHETFQIFRTKIWNYEKCIWGMTAHSKASAFILKHKTKIKIIFSVWHCKEYCVCACACASLCVCVCVSYFRVYVCAVRLLFSFFICAKKKKVVQNTLI